MLPLLAMLLSSNPGPALAWQGGGNGYYDLTVTADGVATYTTRSSRWNPDPKTEGQRRLDKDRLAALHKLLVENKVCQLEGTRRLPVPEERETTLRLDFDGLRCTVQMLSNDWGNSPAARAVSEAISQLAEEVRTAKR